MQDKLKRAMVAIHGVKIPELPDEILELDREINSKFANISSVADIIEKNTTLSGELLKVVNSPIMKLRAPCTSIREAVSSLGLDNLYNLVVASALKNLFGDKGLIKDVMDHSVDVAFCMADIAEWVDDVTRDEAYMFGLFHNCGALLLASKDEKKYAPLFSNSMSKPVAILATEERLYNSNHAMIGVLMAKKWKLPIDMIQAIMFHHTPECSKIKNDKVRAMVAMVKVANSIIAEISLGAYRGDEMKAYELDGLEELMIPYDVVAEIRTAVMSYTMKS